MLHIVAFFFLFLIGVDEACAHQTGCLSDLKVNCSDKYLEEKTHSITHRAKDEDELEKLTKMEKREQKWRYLTKKCCWWCSYRQHTPLGAVEEKERGKVWNNKQVLITTVCTLNVCLKKKKEAQLKNKHTKRTNRQKHTVCKFAVRLRTERRQREVSGIWWNSEKSYRNTHTHTHHSTHTLTHNCTCSTAAPWWLSALRFRKMINDWWSDRWPPTQQTNKKKNCSRKHKCCKQNKDLFSTYFQPLCL